MQKDREAALPQLHHRPSKKVQVLEAPSAQANPVNPVACPDPATDFSYGRAQGVMKTGGYLPRLPPGREVPGDGDNHWTKIHVLPLEGKVVAIVDSRFDRALQRYGGLAFKGHLPRQSQHGGDGVEEPPAGGGLYRLNAPGKHDVDQRDLLIVYTLERGGGFAKGVAQIAERHAPRLAYGCIPTGKQYIAQVSTAGEAGKIRHQEFATPDLAVRAISRSIHGDTQHLSAQLVLGHATRDVRMVMLDADFALNGCRQGHARAHVTGVQIVGHGTWRYLENMFHAVQCFCEEAHRLIVLQIAEIDAAIERAKLLDGEPLAKTATYWPSLKLLIVDLTNGRRLALPIEDLQGLESAQKKQLQNVEVLSLGTEVNFPDLDTGFYVPSLIEGVYGNRRWMSELGKRGGQAKTEAKQIASRANGAKGGRPKKAASLGAFVKRRDVKGGRPKSAPPGR